jgi:nucleotide-binding universal stress UspA family protein
MSRAEDRLCLVADRLGLEGIAAETQICCDEPVQAILDAADRHGVDLIVMSTHGRSEVGRMLFGSVADLVLRRASIPVLVVPSIVEQAWAGNRALSLLVPLDGSALAEEAIVPAERLAAAFGSPLTLLRVVDPPTHPIYGPDQAYVPFDEAAEVARAQRYLEQRATTLRADGGQVETRVVLGEPARKIAETAGEQKVGLIVMATHGRGQLRRLVLGSIALSVLRQTTAPLLVVRPAAMQEVESDRCICTMDRARADVTSDGSPATGSRASSLDNLELSASDLELITSGLRALAYAPGYDYGHVLAARALASRLEESIQANGQSLVVAS